jgi:hypothetical protein
MIIDEISMAFHYLDLICGWGCQVPRQKCIDIYNLQRPEDLFLKAKETKKCCHRDDDDDLVEFCQL